MREAVVRTRSTLARRAGWWSPAAQRMPEAAPACSGHGPLRSAWPQALYHHPAPERSWLQLVKVWAPSVQGVQRSWSRSSVLKPQPSWLSVWPKPRNASPARCGGVGSGPAAPQAPARGLAIWDPRRAGTWGGTVFPRAQRLADVGRKVGGSRDPTSPTHPGLLQESPSCSLESPGAKQDTWGQAQGFLTSPALTCVPRVQAEGQLVKLVLLVHVEVIIVGLKCVVVRVQEIHHQL